MLITTINSSIVLIALPDIFRGIHLDPLLPGNTSYLLWMMMGFMVATAVLVVTFGRIGDMYGRVRMFNLGLAVFTVCSILLSLTWMQGSDGRALADRDARRPGRRRRARDGQLLGHPDRRLPEQRARPGARRQRGGGHRGLVHGSRAGRPAGARQLAARVPGVRAVRRLRHGVGVLEAAGARRAPAGARRLVGQCDVRGRADPRARLDHLRHPALRRSPDGLDESARARRADLRRCCCSRSSS